MTPSSDAPRVPRAFRGTGGEPVDIPGLPVSRPGRLPEEVEVSLRANAMTSLAENAAGGLGYAVQAVPDVGALVTCLQLRDVLSSARMAGYTATPVETWQAALRLTHHPRGSAGRGREDVDAATAGDPLWRFIHAARLLAEKTARGEPNDIDLLGAVSATLTGLAPRSAREGLRRHEGVLTSGPDGPPYLRTTPPEQLERALADWDAWMASPFEGPRLPRIAVGHAELELMQPYPEANGHVARLFSSAEMVRRGLIDTPVLSLSPWLDDNIEEYHRRLRDVALGGDWSPWVEFFARGVREQALATVDLIRAQDRLRGELADAVEGSPSLHKVVAALPTSPVTSIQALITRHGINERTAAQITRDLVDQGVLRVLVERPFRIFVCDRAMDVLSLQRAEVSPHVPDAFLPEPPPRSGSSPTG